MRTWMGRFGRTLLRLPRRIPVWWCREYADFRVILEQRGHLHYYAVPSRLQKRLVQGSILLSAATLLVLIGLATTSLRLGIAKWRLERSHRAIHAALLGQDPGATPEVSGSTRMIELIKAIQERQLALRQYVDLSFRTYADQNQGLMNQLQATGLTEQAIRTIERASAHGGNDLSPVGSTLPADLLPSPLVNEILQNRALLETLRALPAQIPLKAWEISSDFGIRKHPITGIVQFHTGVDLTLGGPEERIFPAKHGQVVSAQAHPQYGNMVILQHAHGIETLYGHLERIDVSPGQMVSLDTPLGVVGSTGSSTGRHLHFEILIGGYPANPLKVIKAARNVQQIPLPERQTARS